MSNQLKPGNMDIAFVGNDDMADSMADTIDHEFDRLLTAAGLPGLSFDTTVRDVRDRRRLFVAIARGVVMHLKTNATAFSVNVPASDAIPATVTAAIATNGVS